MNIKIAFWRHDSFPYILHGKINKYLQDEWVECEGYSGYKFKPFLILSESESNEIITQLLFLKNLHKSLIMSIDAAFDKQVENLFKKYISSFNL